MEDKYTSVGIDGFMAPIELDWLFGIAKNKSTILEIGSWKGKSTHALLSGCKNGKVTSVDHFLGSKGQKMVVEDGSGKSIYDQFMSNVGHLGNLEVCKMSSEEAAKKLRGKKFDVVFIDGEHTYEGVKRDIELWKDSATKIISGHDYCETWPGVVKAVDEAFGKVEVCGSIWYKILDSDSDDGEPIPWMTYEAVDWLGKNVKKDYKVFEWGTGNSTLYFLNKVEYICSVEHDKNWYNSVLGKLTDLDFNNYDYKLVEPEKNGEGYRSHAGEFTGQSFKKYCHEIDSYPDNYFDLIVVDGRARFDCARLAMNKVKDGGYIVLDNAERAQYAQIHELFKDWGKIVFYGHGPYNLNKWGTAIFSKKINKKKANKITLAVTTWPKIPERMECLKKTLKSLDMMTATGFEITKILSCESAQITPKIKAEVEALGWPTRWRESEPALGPHLNEIFAPQEEFRKKVEGLIMYVQDDCPLAAPLDLAEGANLILLGDVKMVRYWSEGYKLEGGKKFNYNGDDFIKLPDNCPEQFSCRPFLVHADFMREIGPFVATRDHEMNMDCRFKELKINVAARIPSIFGHVGRESVIKPGVFWKDKNLGPLGVGTKDPIEIPKVFRNKNPDMKAIHESWKIPKEKHPERLYALNNITSSDRVIYDLGCSRYKTLDKAIGVDIRPVADVVSNIDSMPLIKDNSADVLISRHSLEHMQDIVKTLLEWKRILKPGGKMIIVLPDDEFLDAMGPLVNNREHGGDHLHVFTRDSLRNIVQLIPGLSVESTETLVKDWSFGMIIKKN